MKIQSSVSYNIQSIKLGGNVFSPIVSGVKGLAKAVFSALSGVCSSAAPSDSLLSKLAASPSLSGVLKRTFQVGSVVTQKRENRQLAVTSLRKAVIIALSNGDLSLENIKNLALKIANQGEAPPPAIAAKYINKLSHRALSWAKKNEQIGATVRQVIAEHKERHEPKIGDLNWNKVKRLSRTRDEILQDQSILNLKSPHGEVIDLLVNHELDSSFFYETGGKAELCVRGAYVAELEQKGLEALGHGLVKHLSQLENQIEQEINKHVLTALKNPSTLGRLTREDGLYGSVAIHFQQIKSNEPWVHFPGLISQFVELKCEECFTTGPLHQVKKLYNEIQSTVKQWHEELFNLGVQQAPVRVKYEKALEIFSDFEQSNLVAAKHPDLLEYLITNEMQAPVPYNFFHLQHPSRPSETQFTGGYFKAHKKTGAPALSATRVMGAEGKTYELLNRVSGEASRALLEQHRLNVSDKLVFGKGSYGKARLARDLDTGDFVAVKKFKTRRGVSSVQELNQEMENLKKVKIATERFNDWTPEDSKSLASVLDFAHVEIPRKSSRGGSVDKSYLFMPLSNAGDGASVMHQLTDLRAEGKQHEADQRFLHVAKGYAKSVMNLHKLGFHHRDIKPGNFLHSWVKAPQSNQGQAEAWIEETKLTDFGTLQSPAMAKNSIIDGTYVYCPPEKHEFLECKQPYNAEKHDVFSLGVSLLELKTGQLSSQFPKGHEPIAPQSVLTLKRNDGVTEHFQVPLEALKKSEAIQHGHAFWRTTGIPTDRLHNLDMTHPDNIIAKLIATDQKERLTAKQAFDLLSQLE